MPRTTVVQDRDWIVKQFLRRVFLGPRDFQHALRAREGRGLSMLGEGRITDPAEPSLHLVATVKNRQGPGALAIAGAVARA